MTQVEQIKAEIKRLMMQASEMNRMYLLTKEQEVCILSQMSRLLSFIDSLPEEKAVKENEK